MTLSKTVSVLLVHINFLLIMLKVKVSKLLQNANGAGQLQFAELHFLFLNCIIICTLADKEVVTTKFYRKMYFLCASVILNSKDFSLAVTLFIKHSTICFTSSTYLFQSSNITGESRFFHDFQNLWARGQSFFCWHPDRDTFCNRL